MPDLYSLNGALPAPLPHRLRVPDGASGYRTRTDAASFTEAEIEATGYTGLHELPSYEPAREVRAWNAAGLTYVVSERLVAERQAEMDAALTARFKALIAEGYTVNGVVIDIEAGTASTAQAAGPE